MQASRALLLLTLAVAAAPAVADPAAPLNVPVQLGERVRLEAWPAVDRFESENGRERMVRVQAGLRLRYARDGLHLGAEAQYRVADLGSVPRASALDERRLMARFALRF